MSPIALLGNPALLWDYYVAGPWLRNAATSGAFTDYIISNLLPIWPEIDGTAAGRPVWEHSQGGSGIVQSGAVHKGVLCMQASTTVITLINGMGGIDIMPITDITGLDPGYRQPSWRRVQWLTLNLAIDDGVLDDRTGVLFVQGSGAQSTPIWPVAPSVVWTGGWGIVGDGAGGWDWKSYGHETNFSVPPTTIETVSLAPAISDASDWHTFDFVHISGAGGREASFELHIDGELFLTRDWVNAPALDSAPIAPPDASTGRRWFPVWQVGTPSGDNMNFGDWEFRMGRFLPDGRELLK